jgi:hypothetical protein
MQSSGGGGGGGTSSLPTCAQQLLRHMETITSHYIALEEYFVCRRANCAQQNLHPLNSLRLQPSG